MRSQEIHEHQEISIIHIVHISSVTSIFYKTSVYRNLKIAQLKVSCCQHVSGNFYVCFQDVILCLPPSSQANVSAVPKAAETLLRRQIGKENTTAFFL